LTRLGRAPATPRDVVVALAPTLELFDDEGWLRGVRFAHQRRCAWCRQLVTSYSGGGWIVAGLTRRGGLVRWYETQQPGGRFTRPAACPWCDEPDGLGHAREDLAGPVDYYRLIAPGLHQIWQHIRTRSPLLAAAADAEAGIRWQQ
jgi:hypothetical protein